MSDAVNHPSHYNRHPSGIEAIVICEHMNFCLGNTVKYIFRAGLKEGAEDLQDLKKAQWYLQREIERREKAARQPSENGLKEATAATAALVGMREATVALMEKMEKPLRPKSGRPSKLTPELQKRICDYIRYGNSREITAHCVGISAERMSKWMHRPEPMYREFQAAVLEAEKVRARNKALSRWREVVAETKKKP